MHPSLEQKFYVGRDLEVVASPGRPGAPLLLTLSEATEGNHRGSPFGWKLAAALGMPLVAVIATRNHWYQTREVVEVGAFLNGPACPEHVTRIGYGSSMGAYGLLLHRRLLGLDRIVAVAPQTTLALEAPLPDLWRGWIQDLEVLWDDIPHQPSSTTKIDLIYDPADPTDLFHANQLKGDIRVRKFLTPFSGHPPITFLRRAGIIKGLMCAVIDGSAGVKEFRRGVRSVRGTMPVYFEKVARHLTQQGRKARAMEFTRREIRCLEELKDKVGADRLNTQIRSAHQRLSDLAATADVSFQRLALAASRSVACV